jgi:hypothetical protein
MKVALWDACASPTICNIITSSPAVKAGNDEGNVSAWRRGMEPE